MTRILVVEDDPAIADTIATALGREGWEVSLAGLLAQARTLAGSSCDAVVLDVGLPDGSGLDLCLELRAASSVPILFLSSRADEIDRIVGLEIGADDYLTKPFSPRELVARLRALLRRAGPVQRPAGGFAVDAAAQRIRWRGRTLDLTRQEYRLLAALCEHRGAVLSRTRLLDLAWDDPAGPYDRAVDATVRDLRVKLRAIDADADPIRTVRGEGYALEDA